MSNPSKLDRTTALVQVRPDLHGQDRWMCGTAACYAGWTVLLEHGHQPGVETPHFRAWTFTDRDGTDWTGGHAVSVEAQEILGLTHHEANQLFIPSGRRPEARAIRIAQALSARDRGVLDAGSMAVLREEGLPSGMPTSDGA